MKPIMTPDDDRPSTIEGCLVPQIPKDLTAEQAAALLAEIWASDVLPDHANVLRLRSPRRVHCESNQS